MKRMIAFVLVAFLLLQGIVVFAATSADGQEDLFNKTIRCTGTFTAETYVSPGVGQSFGVRINTNGGYLVGVELADVATWDREVKGIGKIWSWNTDYATTVSAEPLKTQEFSGMLNNQNRTPFDVSDLNLQPGEYYVEFECTNDGNGGGWTPWVYKNVTNREFAVEYYKLGTLTDKAFPININLLSDGSVTEYVPPAQEPDDDSFAVDSDPNANSVQLGGEAGQLLSLSTIDVVATQFVTTSDMKSLSISVPSCGNNTGRMTLELYEFDRNYKYTLKGLPLALYTFENFADNGYLTFLFDENPLPAGEYMLAIRDVEDPSPMVGGGEAPGIGLWYGQGHESQRFYRNGKEDAKVSLKLHVEYVESPSSPYGSPSEPEDIPLTHDELSPKMDSVVDGTDRKNVMQFLNYADMAVAYADGYVRLQTNGAARDPRTYVYFPGGNIDSANFPIMLIKLRLSEDAPLDYQVFYQSTTMDEISLDAMVSGQYEDTTDWQYALVNFGVNPNTIGVLKNLRWDIFNSTDARYSIDVEYIAFFQSVEAAIAFMGKDNFEDYRLDDPSEDPDDNTPGVEITDPTYTQKPTFEENGQRSFNEIKYFYTMDASKTLEDYRNGAQFGISGASNASVSGGVLHAAADGRGLFGIYTKKILGDKYALTEGVLTFDMELNGGYATIGSRLVIRSDDADLSGLYFELSRDGTIHVIEKSSGCDLTFASGKILAGKHTYRLTDSENKIALYADDTLLCSVEYQGHNKSFTVLDAKGNTKGTFESATLPTCGYASLRFSDFSGYADNITYTHSEITQKKFTAEYQTDYTTWNAVDDLDRTTLTESTVDPDKKVGVFYFVFHGGQDTRETTVDTTKLYLEGGVKNIQSVFRPMASSGGAYWAEPYFGYYRTSDEWVLRKHANMLSAAGVDFVFLDLSNNMFYMDDVKLMFDTWLAMRAEGQTTPQICMMFGDIPYYTLNGIYTMYEEIYHNEAYKDLLFMYEDKPLILGNLDRPGSGNWTSYMQTEADFRALLDANPEVKEFYETNQRTILREFTFRKCWAFKNYDSNGNGSGHYGYWDYLQYLPQAAGTNKNGEIEQITVSMGIDAHRGLGRSLVENRFFESSDMASYNTIGEYGFGLSTTAQGLFFQKQFENALKSEAKLMMITGWNEWSAGIQKAAADQQTGQTSSPGWTLIDQFSPEYSRDGEPMKIRDGVGFGDNYYYQMVSYIRQFKGMADAPATTNGGAINMSSANIDKQWEGINPTFTDGVNDTVLRNAYSMTADQVYINNTARNDIAYAKISQDAEALYFYAKTANTMINVDDETWMNLYVDLDGDHTTGWEGFDILINRSRTANTASVEKFVDGKWEFVKLGDAEMVLGENSITLKVSREMLSIDKTAISLNFKWADNAAVEGDIMKFMELGDAAPDDRFFFTYTASGTDNERQETETTDDPESETNPDIESETDSVTDETETTAVKPKGCSSVIGIVPVVLLALGAGVVLARKRKSQHKPF